VLIRQLNKAGCVPHAIRLFTDLPDNAYAVVKTNGRFDLSAALRELRTHAPPRSSHFLPGMFAAIT
jgi:hypothetical protein